MREGTVREEEELALVLREDEQLRTGEGWSRIAKGYSGDRLYVGSCNGRQCLLRIYDGERQAAKQAEYDHLRHFASRGVRCPEPLKLAMTADRQVGYMLATYIPGEDGETALPSLSAEAQYAAGLAAGSELRLLHQLAAPPEWPDWHEAKTAKHYRYVEQYRSCGVRLAGDEAVLAYIERHLDAMKGRPNLFQHDDYHPGNLVFRDGAFAGVVDFGRWDWGDPVHEFLKVGMFTVETSIPFAIGQIRGYHDGREPDAAFWRLYALYMAMAVVSSVAWVVRFHPQETNEMLVRLGRVLDDHRGFELERPAWADVVF